jgi:hypothetical protein
MSSVAQAQSFQVHDDQHLSDNSTQFETPEAAEPARPTAVPASLLDRFMQEFL